MSPPIEERPIHSELARILYISETPANTQVTRILNKLRLRDRVQAVVMAYEPVSFAQGPRVSHPIHRAGAHRTTTPNAAATSLRDRAPTASMSGR